MNGLKINPIASRWVQRTAAVSIGLAATPLIQSCNNEVPTLPKSQRTHEVVDMSRPKTDLDSQVVSFKGQNGTVYKRSGIFNNGKGFEISNRASQPLALIQITNESGREIHEANMYHPTENYEQGDISVGRSANGGLQVEIEKENYKCEKKNGKDTGEIKGNGDSTIAVLQLKNGVLKVIQGYGQSSLKIQKPDGSPIQEKPQALIDATKTALPFFPLGEQPICFKSSSSTGGLTNKSAGSETTIKNKKEIKKTK